MKTIIPAILATLLISAAQPQLTLAQGSLTPPGAPAPTMKSADQIEPRTIINAANNPGDANSLFIINQSGSYYLTTNISGVTGKSGIKITANNVTLDLNGFTLQGVPGGTNGIYLPSTRTNVTVRNGSISNWPRHGVAIEGTASVGVVLDRLSVGTCFFGISAAGSVSIRDCVCQANLGGINCTGSAHISGCTANSNGNFVQGGGGIYAFSGAVIGCSAMNNADFGIDQFNGLVSNCSAQNNLQGIRIGRGMVTGCLVSSNSHNGILLYGSGGQVVGNTCIANNTSKDSSSAGIYVDAANCRVEENHVTGSGFIGIDIDTPNGGKDIVVKNSVSGSSSVNYYFPAGNLTVPILNDNTGALTNSNPWGNFSF